MRFLRTNTATRITIGPFLDRTDGVTPETALTVTACKLTLMVDTANVPTLILDTAPTASGGANDMVHVTGDDAGFYDLELAAADVNYLGRAMLAITDAATHCPVFHEFMIVPAMVYDSLFLGTDRFDANVTHVADTAQTARDIGASVLLSSGTGTGQLDFTSGVVKANATQWLGGTIPAVNVTGVPKVDVIDWLGTAPLALSSQQVQAVVPTTQKVDVETIKTNPVVNAGTVTFPTGATLASTTNITAGTITTATNVTTVNDKTGYSLSGTTTTLDALQTALNSAHGSGSWATATGFSTLDAAGVRTAVGLASANLDTQLAAIVADTNEVQLSLAFGGTIYVMVSSLQGDTTLLVNSTVATTGAVNDAAATTTVFKTNLSAVDDFYNDCTLTFTNGALDGQTKPILDFSATNGTITLSEALTSAPANNVQFQVNVGHTHPVSQIQSGLATASAVSTMQSDVTAILADTDSLDTTKITTARAATLTDLIDGGRLDLIFDAINLVTTRLATAYELDGSVYRWTTNALEQAPGGSTSVTLMPVSGAATIGNVLEGGKIIGQFGAPLTGLTITCTTTSAGVTSNRDLTAYSGDLSLVVFDNDDGQAVLDRVVEGANITVSSNVATVSSTASHVLNTVVSDNLRWELRETGAAPSIVFAKGQYVCQRGPLSTAN